jgi:hypothetical protein
MVLQTTAVVRQKLSSDHVGTLTDTKEQLHSNRGMVISVRSVLRCYKQTVSDASSVESNGASWLEDRWGSVLVSCCCEKLVAETGDSSGT